MLSTRVRMKFFERAEKLKADVKILFYNHGYILNAMKNKKIALLRSTHRPFASTLFLAKPTIMSVDLYGAPDFRQAIDHFSEMLRYAPLPHQCQLESCSMLCSRGRQGGKEIRERCLDLFTGKHPGNANDSRSRFISYGENINYRNHGNVGTSPKTGA